MEKFDRMENIAISTDRTQFALNVIHEFLQQSYGAKDISRASTAVDRQFALLIEPV